MNPIRFFDNASTTRCCEEAAARLKLYAEELYGNPSSSHRLGEQSAKAIREARLFFARVFLTEPDGVIFTGSGTEADNLAILGVALGHTASGTAARTPVVSTPPLPASPVSASAPPRILISATEHPAVKKAALSLLPFGFDVQLIPVDQDGQILEEKYLDLLTPATLLVSIQQVNNITGSQLPVERLARLAKDKVPSLYFHTDAVQAFGKVEAPKAGTSAVDLVSISGHKIFGPKGVGALLILNSALLKNKLRPLLFGGDQEGGLRAGTQNAGLISGFHVAAEKALNERKANFARVTELREQLHRSLVTQNLLLPSSSDVRHSPIRNQVIWNSPQNVPGQAIPHIVNLSVPGIPSGPLTRVLEERGFLISSGSACHSHSNAPDPVLQALALPLELQLSAIRISFSPENSLQDVEELAAALQDSIAHVQTLLGGKRKP